MKPVKKILFILLLASFIIIPASKVNVYAATEEPPVSPALSIIANNLNMKKSGLVETSLYFTSRDFEDFLLNKSLKSITVSTLPSEFEGTLYLGEVPVIANQTIYKGDLGNLKFVPASADISSSSFGFFENGASCETPIKCSMYLLPEINTSPVLVQDVMNKEELSTTKNIMVYSTLYAEDNEDDNMIFEITTYPEHGIATFYDAQNGKYTYTPALDYVGKDKFEYVVYDVYGNRSEKAWVNINVEKNKNNVFFSDMLRHQDHNYAVKATNYNIMSGKLIDGKMAFSPDSTVTRAEFLSMALKACGIDKKLTEVKTGFADDRDIPVSLKGYVSYAVSAGYVSGKQNEQGVFFYPNEPITRVEAAVMINGILNAEAKSVNLLFSDKDDIPSWAEKDISALAELDIISAMADGSYSPNTSITNAEAAKIFCKLYELN